MGIKLITIFMSCLALTAEAGVFEPPTTDYEVVLQGQTDQVLGPVGASGDVLENLIIAGEMTGSGACGTSYPVGSTSYPVGAVSIKDGSGTAIKIKDADFYSVSEGAKIQSYKIGARSRDGAWKVTTGCNVHVIGVGRFK